MYVPPCKDFPLRIYAILRYYDTSGISHVVVTNAGLAVYGARLPPYPQKWLEAHNNLDKTIFLSDHCLMFGDVD